MHVNQIYHTTRFKICKFYFSIVFQYSWYKIPTKTDRDEPGGATRPATAEYCLKFIYTSVCLLYSLPGNEPR